MFPIMRRSNVYDPVDTVQREFDRALGRWFGGDGGDYELIGAYPVDIREDDEHVYVDAEIPGFKKDEINVTMENGMLHISGERKVEKTKGESHLSERRYTKISRSFTLPTAVNESNVDAKLDNGVLHLILNKREEVKPRKIEVK